MITQARNNRNLTDRFREEPWRFDFWQSVKLLRNENYRFAANVSQGFPASDVQEWRPDEKKLSVNFLGLAGPHGPLPPPITELVLDRVKRGDTALRDFLDIFNHRLVSLYYDAVAPMRPGCGVEKNPAETEFADYLYAVSGLLTEGLHEKEHVRWLPFAALLANVRKTASRLEKIVTTMFGISCTVEEFQGRWLTIDKSDRTLLGKTNHRLGETAMLGGRFWNQSAGIVLRLERRMENVTTLKKAVRFYLGDGVEYEIRQPRASSVWCSSMRSNNNSRIDENEKAHEFSNA